MTALLRQLGTSVFLFFLMALGICGLFFRIVDIFACSGFFFFLDS
jgi:hypothetical protein